MKRIKSTIQVQYNIKTNTDSNVDSDKPISELLKDDILLVKSKKKASQVELNVDRTYDNLFIKKNKNKES